MANTKISDLTTASALAAADVAPFVQGGANVKATVQQIITAATGATGTNGETVTTSKPRLDLTQTWNNVATTFTGIKLNVTDTASAAASLLMDLQVGGASRISVTKAGVLRLPSTQNSVFITPSDATTTGFGAAFAGGNPEASILVSNTIYYQAKASSNNFRFAISVSTDPANPGASGSFIFPDAANTLAQRNGVNAQTFRLYNTFTDASNYERGKMEWGSNVLRIGTEKAGTGSARALEFQTDGVTRLTIAATGDVITNSIGATSGNNLIFRGASTGAAWRVVPGGNFEAQADNAYDIGAATANRPRNVHQTGYIQTSEMTAPAAPAANGVRIFAEDDGAGKTRLMALFATGAAVQIAIEP
jgi:hypothetical protein